MTGGGGRAWVDLPTGAEQEALTLECVKLAAAPGVDLNLANDDGKTALDAANSLRYAAVIKYLTDLGAKAGADYQGYGLSVVESVPLEVPPATDVTRRYMKTKKDKLGHILKGV